MRIAFLGSPDFALPALNALVAAGHEIVCVYSQPPRPRGRGQKLVPTIIHARALELGLEVRTPKTLRDPIEQAAFAALDLDIAIVVAYGLILPKAILDTPKHGCLNIHPSLLPRWRGAAPIQRCIEAGDSVTSVQIMAMDEGLDTGAIYASQDEVITPNDTYGTMSEKCATIGAEMLIDTLLQIATNNAKAIKQSDEGVTYAGKISKDEARIDWSKSAQKIDFMIRGFSPIPAAWCMLDGVRYKILMSRYETGEGPAGETLDDELLVACGTDAIRILRLQREGKPALDAHEFLRGQKIAKGTVWQ